VAFYFLGYWQLDAQLPGVGQLTACLNRLQLMQL
jgi:hypothetical protein